MSEATKRYADCLTSAVTVGRLIDSSELKEIKGNEGVIVYFKQPSVQVLGHICENTSVKGILVNYGSFAGHLSGFLNSSGIQMAVSESFIFPTNNKISPWVKIDGSTCSITIYREKPSTGISISSGPAKKSDRKYDMHIFVDGKNEKELAMGLNDGAEGIGILKTDWMGWLGENPPSVVEHLKLYESCLKISKNKRLNIRLFDIGGDKIPGWAKDKHKLISSPIGYRGVRSLDIFKEAFDNQIEAIANISKKTEIGVVLPMVTSREEIIHIKNIFRNTSPKGFGNIHWGIMVETPESALTVKDLLKESDFVRIGPGDLSQACLAMDRNNIGPNYYSRLNLSAGVFKLIKMTATVCIKTGKEINICQDLEPCEELVEKIIETGVNTFCVSHASVKSLMRFKS